MSGGRYQYIFEDDWNEVRRKKYEFRKLIGDAYYEGYEGFAAELKNWVKDYLSDDGVGWDEELGTHTAVPKDESVKERWHNLRPVIKAFSWWMCGDTGEESFREKLMEADFYDG